MFSKASRILFAVWLVTPLLPVEIGFGVITFRTGCAASPSVGEFVLIRLYPAEWRDEAPPKDVLPR